MRSSLTGAPWPCVPAHEAIWALGTDTGGSIRQPASFCGVVGLKPTYGRVSRYGIVAYASSLDQVGPLARDVTDAANVLNVISGLDEMDSTSSPSPVPDFTKALREDVKGLKIGLPKEYFTDGMDPEVEKAVKDAIEQYRSLGAEIVEISLPHTKYAISTYYLIAPAEAATNLQRYDGALLLGEDGQVYRRQSPNGTLVNSVGAGDSMVAGFLAGFEASKGDLNEALKMGISAGSASAFHEWLATEDDIKEVYAAL